MSKVREKQIKRRSEILKRVMKLTEKTPLSELSIKDICEEIGISVGSFYHYFKEKSALVCGLMELIDSYMEEQVQPQLTNESAMENLRTICLGFARHIHNSGLEQAKQISVCKPTDVDDYGVRRPTFRMIESVVAQGQQKGEFRTDMTSEKITEMVLIAISGVTIDWSRREASYDLLERMDEYVTFFFRALLK
jgi:AcrR family transcriptional regulator